MKIVAGGVRSAGAALILGPWARGFPARTPPDSSVPIPGDRFRGLPTSACGLRGHPCLPRPQTPGGAALLSERKRKKKQGVGRGKKH